jgi:hypothetical protein
MGCGPDSAPSGPDQPVQPQASLLGGLIGAVGDVTEELTGTVGDVTGTVGGVVEGTTELVGGVVNSLLSPLVCPTDRSYSETRTIGRNGGTIRVGPHTLTIPAGALSRYTLITATAPKGSYAEVEFAPHGLKFQRDVTLTISYAQCGVLNGRPPAIVYADDDRNILEILESSIDRRSETVTGKTDHFSSYILAE